MNVFKWITMTDLERLINKSREFVIDIYESILKAEAKIIDLYIKIEDKKVYAIIMNDGNMILFVGSDYFYLNSQNVKIKHQDIFTFIVRDGSHLSTKKLLEMNFKDLLRKYIREVKIIRNHNSLEMLVERLRYLKKSQRIGSSTYISISVSKDNVNSTCMVEFLFKHEIKLLKKAIKVSRSVT